MYPAHYFSLYPPFPRTNRVFVAMSFDPRFEARWKNVIHRGVGLADISGVPLEAYRVDARVVSDSILTEILEGIARSRLFLADITTIGKIRALRKFRRVPVRNGNVMYEVGLAQAMRLPEETLLFRSDNDPLLFDTLNVRVNHYSPDESPDQAAEHVGAVVREALKELDLRRSISVRTVVDSLDEHMIQLLLESTQAPIAPPAQMTMRNVLGNTARIGAITRLLAVEAFRNVYRPLTITAMEKDLDTTFPGFASYEITTFGRSLVGEITRRLGLQDPEIQAAIERVIADDSSSATPGQ